MARPAPTGAEEQHAATGEVANDGLGQAREPLGETVHAALSVCVVADQPSFRVAGHGVHGSDEGRPGVHPVQVLHDAHLVGYSDVEANDLRVGTNGRHQVLQAGGGDVEGKVGGVEVEGVKGTVPHDGALGVDRGLLADDGREPSALAYGGVQRVGNVRLQAIDKTGLGQGFHLWGPSEQRRPEREGLRRRPWGLSHGGACRGRVQGCSSQDISGAEERQGRTASPSPRCQGGWRGEKAAIDWTIVGVTSMLLFRHRVVKGTWGVAAWAFVESGE